MLLAQSLGEYSGLTGALSSGLETVRAVVEDQARQLDPTTWLAIVAGAIVLWFVVLRVR